MEIEKAKRPRWQVSLFALTVFFQASQLPLAQAGTVQPKGKSTAVIKRPAPVSAVKKPAATELPSGKLKAGSKEFLWKVTSESGATLYLLGTIHVVKPSFYPLPDEMEKALEKSRSLIVEFDVTRADPKKTQELTIRKGVYAPSDSLANHIPPELLAEVQTACAEKGLPFAGIQRMKPWLIGLTLVQMEMERLGYSPKQGIDIHLINKAHATGKKVSGLETEEFQIDLISGFPADLQEQMLKQSVHDMKELKDDANQLMKAWKDGDEKSMDQLLTKDLKEHPEFIPLQEKLIYDRNIPMAEKLEPYLKGADTFMVAVGSAHLIGEKGICEILRKKGYKVEQVLAGEKI